MQHHHNAGRTNSDSTCLQNNPPLLRNDLERWLEIKCHRQSLVSLIERISKSILNPFPANFEGRKVKTTGTETHSEFEMYQYTVKRTDKNVAIALQDVINNLIVARVNEIGLAAKGKVSGRLLTSPDTLSHADEPQKYQCAKWVLMNPTAAPVSDCIVISWFGPSMLP